MSNGYFVMASVRAASKIADRCFASRQSALSVDLRRLVNRIDEDPRNQLPATIPHADKVDLDRRTPYSRDRAA
jgi:hypothetical protein